MDIWVVSYNAGVLGVYKSEFRARQSAREYKYADYKGVKVERFGVYE